MPEDGVDVVRSRTQKHARTSICGRNAHPFAVASHAIGCAGPEVRSPGFGACEDDWGKQGVSARRG
jgi:hypothetical protein